MLGEDGEIWTGPVGSGQNPTPVLLPFRLQFYWLFSNFVIRGLRFFNFITNPFQQEAQ